MTAETAACYFTMRGDIEAAGGRVRGSAASRRVVAAGRWQPMKRHNARRYHD